MSQTHALKLRIYPNQTQKSLIHTYFRARQWAYHLGIELNKEEWSIWNELAESFPEYKRDMPYPKWKGSRFLSKMISIKKQEIELYNKANKEPHKDSFVLVVPRCIFSQALNDFQRCLNKAFKDRIEKKLPKSRMSGFPHFYSLYKRRTFRYQIDKPSTNKKHISTWKDGKIRLGDLVLKYKDPTKLPKKIPSLVTVSQNPYGQHFASFISTEPRTYQNQLKEAKRINRKELLSSIKILSTKQSRSLGYDPNMNLEFFFDSRGLSFSMSEFECKKKLEIKLLKQARYLSKTVQYNKKNKIKASNRSLKAKKALTKIYNDRNNSKRDYQEKLTSIMALFYPNQARECLNIKDMIEKNGKTQSRLRKDRTYKKYKLSRNFAHVSMASQRALMSEKLERIHGENHKLVILDKYERTTQCCSSCKEERLVVKLGTKVWCCPYCKTVHNRDECAAINVLDKGFGLSSNSKTSELKPNPIDFKLTFPDLELDPKKGFPVARSAGLGVGKHHRFVKWKLKKENLIKNDLLGEFEIKLFDKLSNIGILRVVENKS